MYRKIQIAFASDQKLAENARERKLTFWPLGRELERLFCFSNLFTKSPPC